MIFFELFHYFASYFIFYLNLCIIIQKIYSQVYVYVYSYKYICILSKRIMYDETFVCMKYVFVFT